MARSGNKYWVETPPRTTNKHLAFKIVHAIDNSDKTGQGSRAALEISKLNIKTEFKTKERPSIAWRLHRYHQRKK